MRSGVAELPLHPGKAPPWLFKRMVSLAKEITGILCVEYGPNEFLKRISDPYWFQAISCVLGYDWHSSGTTTVTCGALKVAINSEFGIAVLGGKGSASRKTPSEIDAIAEKFSFSDSKINELKRASKLSAKVDSAVLQDGYSLYHHSFLVTESGNWAVIQQGMNEKTGYARRYHWLKPESFVCDPHNAVCCDMVGKALNMAAGESEDARNCSVDIVCDSPSKLKSLISNLTGQSTLFDYDIPDLKMPREHWMDIKKYSALFEAHEFQPKNYEELISFPGIGAKNIRALALISKLIYGSEVSWRDPVKYSFAHGGKDGIPYPVDKPIMDKSIEILHEAIQNAKIGEKEKLNAIKKLSAFETY